MSKLLGGLFSRPSGKASGLVFGAGRTRRGKQVTAREYTIPTDPKTSAQLSQRGKMPFVTAIIQAIGAAIYRLDWNRAIKNLPGFQSLSSIFMKIVLPDGSIEELPGTVGLGSLHAPDDISAIWDGNDVAVTFSDELGDNGNNDDQVVVFAVDMNGESTPSTKIVSTSTSAIREDGTVNLPVGAEGGTDWLVGIYLRNSSELAAARDKLSDCKFVKAEMA